MDLEQTLTSRDKINTLLRGVLDDASGKWGIRVTRVEIKAIDPPKSVKDAMEKQMRAEREKRAAILTAEGVRQSKILTAEGDKQSEILRAEGDKAGRHPARRGPGRGDLAGLPGDPHQRPRPEAARLPVPADAAADPANGPGNTFWVIPGEVTTALQGGDLRLHRRSRATGAAALGAPADAAPAAADGPTARRRGRQRPGRRRSRPRGHAVGRGRGPGRARPDGDPGPAGAGPRRRRSTTAAPDVAAHGVAVSDVATPQRQPPTAARPTAPARRPPRLSRRSPPPQAKIASSATSTQTAIAISAATVVRDRP